MIKKSLDRVSSDAVCVCCTRTMEDGVEADLMVVMVAACEPPFSKVRLMSPWTSDFLVL